MCDIKVCNYHGKNEKPYQHLRILEEGDKEWNDLAAYMFNQVQSKGHMLCCTCILCFVVRQALYEHVPAHLHSHHGKNQCWAGIRNCMKPLSGIRAVPKAHNCGSQKNIKTNDCPHKHVSFMKPGGSLSVSK